MAPGANDGLVGERADTMRTSQNPTPFQTADASPSDCLDCVHTVLTCRGQSLSAAAVACSAKTLLQQNSELMNQLIDVSLGGGGADGEEDPTSAGGVSWYSNPNLN